MTSIFDQISALIGRLAPAPVCEDCMTSRLGLDDRERVGQIAHELAGTAGFKRSNEPCALCAAVRPVIGKRTR